MAVSIRQASDADLERLLPFVCDYHRFEKLQIDDELRRAALGNLLADASLGAVWLVLDEAEVIGYIALCKGFSIEFSGHDAFVDEFFIRPESRGRGCGTRVLELIRGEARRLDIRALHLEVARDNPVAQRLYARAGFSPRERYVLMTAELY